MALLEPFGEGSEAFQWKKCNTTSQCCVSCGESMQKGEIALLIKNTHDTTEKQQYLWLCCRCIYRFANIIKAGIETERIYLQKNSSTGTGCIHCGGRVTKGQIHLKLCNASDSIRTKKELWIHRKCRIPFANKIKSELVLPQKR